MSLQTQLDAVVAQAAIDSELLHRIVHGDSGTIVTTEGGPVRSLAGLIADKDADINQAAEGVLAQTADHAARAAADAKEAADAVAGAMTAASLAQASAAEAANSQTAAATSEAGAAASQAAASASEVDAANSLRQIQAAAQTVAQSAALEAVYQTGALLSIKRRVRQIHLLNLFY